MAQIVSFTGSSGVGKTTLAKECIEQLPHARMILSYTTRAPRESDLVGEYAYINEAEFQEKVSRGEFLWTAERRGIYYGTIAKDVSDVANDPDTIGLMILVPETVQKLRDFLSSIGTLSVHVPIFIPMPTTSVLLSRLHGRGDSDAEISKRFAQDSVWEAEVLQLPVPFHVITNEGSVKDAFQVLNTFLTVA